MLITNSWYECNQNDEESDMEWGWESHSSNLCCYAQILRPYTLVAKIMLLWRKQGGQWIKGFMDQGWPAPEIANRSNKEQLRCLGIQWVGSQRLDIRNEEKCIAKSTNTTRCQSRRFLRAGWCRQRAADKRVDRFWASGQSGGEANDSRLVSCYRFPFIELFNESEFQSGKTFYANPMVLRIYAFKWSAESTLYE